MKKIILFIVAVVASLLLTGCNRAMVDVVYKYDRAASFFANTECPNLLMGFQTAEEVQDVNGYETEEQETVHISLTTELQKGETDET